VIVDAAPVRTSTLRFADPLPVRVSIEPPLLKPVPLMVMVWPMAAGFGVTDRVRATTSMLKFADLVSVAEAAVGSVIVTLWLPTGVVIGMTNLNGVNVSVSPLESNVLSAVGPVTVPLEPTST
jgi:hypothetical protein